MTEATISPYAISPELVAAKDELDSAKQKATKLRQRVDEAAADAVALKLEVDSLTLELSGKQADRALADDDQVKALDGEIKKLIEKVDAKSRELNRMNALVEALEAKAPQVDEDVAVAKNLLNWERGVWVGSILDTLRDELAEAVRPLIGVLAKAKAMSQCSEGLRDTLLAAWVPDPQNFMRMTNGAYSCNQGRNLLDGRPDEHQRAEAEAITIALLPINQLISAPHSEYVPLAKRPKPYVRKGYTMHGRAADEAPFGQASKTEPEPVAPKEKRLSMEDLDIEMGHKLVQNLMRDGRDQTSIQQ